MNSRLEKNKPMDFELTLIKGIVVELGKTVLCSVRRMSDGFWWNGTSFGSDTYITNNMIELTGDLGVEARYAFSVVAQNVVETYQFRARHTFSGDASATMFEVEVEAYSEAMPNALGFSMALPSEVVDITAFLQESGIPVTGKSLVVSIQRQSDKKWWTPSTLWATAYGTVAMEEKVGNVAVEGHYVYPFKVPATPTAERYHWSVKIPGTPTRYIKGEIRTADVNISHIDSSKEAAGDFRAAITNVVRGKAIAGTLSLTEMTTDLKEVTLNHYKGRALYWESGPLKDQRTEILSSAGPSLDGKLVFKQVTDIPILGNSFVIV